MKALVYKSTGSWYVIKTEDGKAFNARIKGKFKIDDISSTNPLAVGDTVTVELEGDEGNVMIKDIQQRKNYITRQSPSNRNQHHIIASNLDQSLLFATLRSPKTSLGFIDRFLITSEAYHIPCILVFNKADLYTDKDNERFSEIKAIYEKIGYKVMLISIVENTGIEEVKTLLKDKVTLLSGHSGVGKSSFINTVFPEFSLKTQDVSGWSGKGLHTTTFAEMFDLPFGGKIIDTPGLREFALMDIPKEELCHYLPEMKALMNECRFNNCIHINEPGCAVKAAVERGDISLSRYESYLAIFESTTSRSN
jgi:ribosome biogenesis GTPase / thiamine phosphate phosphatase